MMTRATASIEEAVAYIEAAEHGYERALETDRPWNPVLVNCIMAMIKTNDALMLEHRGHENTDHSRTANALRGLYEDGLISDSFRSNLDSVRRWVVEKKTAVQYQNEHVSQSDADDALKAAERFLRKARTELDD